MKQVISVRDLEEMVRSGRDVRALPDDALLTPSARDFLRDMEGNGVYKSRNGSTESPDRIGTGRPTSSANAETRPSSIGKISSKSSKADLDAYFRTAEIQQLKTEICEVGKRLWQRAYVDGNGGNIAVRVGEDIALCTPTLVSKGFMKPEDICLVDLEGNQFCGNKKRTSEILMHLQIMKRQPRAVATVHCHPPHATAFAVAGVEPPSCMIPEIEVFIGRVPIAPYRTPGTPEMGKLVADLVEQHNTVLMGNHGAVSWSHVSVEDAYFKMEILEAYCRTVWVASQLGAPLKTFSPQQLQDLLKIKQTLGIPDPRIGLKECELCDNNEWRPGVSCAPARGDQPSQGLGSAGGRPPAADAQAEAIVQQITDMVMERLGK